MSESGENGQRGYFKWDDASVTRLRELRAQGTAMHVIAGEIGTNTKSVEGAIRRYQVPLGRVPNSASVAIGLRQVQRTMHAQWQPPTQTLASLRAAIISDLKAERATRPKARAHRAARKRDTLLFEVDPFDLHVGKLAWPDETGEAYDVRIAERVFTDAIEALVAKAEREPVREVVLIVGNDLLQTDTLDGTTTSGTYVDTDTRFIRSFRRAFALKRWAIDRLAERWPVRAVVVPGNHDRQSAFTLGHSLESWYHGESRVTVDNNPKLRKYHRHGVNLLGWTHGSEEKMADLPLLMATEQKEAWAATLHREWHIGHLHKAKEVRFTAADSFNGVRVRVLPSLCAPDAWHYRRGYVGERRSCEAYLWCADTGYAGHVVSNVLPTDAERAA